MEMTAGEQARAYRFGMDIAVVVNLHARRGSSRVAGELQSALPRARVLASRTLDEALGFAHGLRERPPSLLVSAGGDGSAVAILNAVRAALFGPSPKPALAAAGVGALPLVAAEPAFDPVFEPILGVMPLGTGNAWARSVGAPGWRRGVERLARLSENAGVPIPRRRYQLVETCGVAAPFAGTGWDAEILSDFKEQKTGWGLIPRSMRRGLIGYMHALFTRTIPRGLTKKRAEVEIKNLGEQAIAIDPTGKPVLIESGGPGEVLYRGPMSVCGASTSDQLGFGFRAFPFVDSVPGRFCLRVYAGGPLEATTRMHQLWRGDHPLPRNHVFMLTHCKATFSQPVPFEIGGDCVEWKTEVEYRLSDRPIDVLDWRRLG